MCMYAVTAVRHVSNVIGQLTESSVVDVIVVLTLTSLSTAERTFLIALFIYRVTRKSQNSGLFNLISLCCNMHSTKQADV